MSTDSISQETYERIERNRRDGRYCRGMSRSRAGCSTRSTVKITQESWVYRIGKGRREVHEMEMCPRHARQLPDGYEGVNFRVLSRQSF